VAAFSVTDCADRLLHASSRPLPPPAAALLAELMRAVISQLTLALHALARLSDALRAAHGETQAALLRVRPAERGQPAWSVLSGQEAAWEPLLRDMGTLANFAIRAGDAKHVFASHLEHMRSDFGNDAPGAELLALLRVACAPDEDIVRGGRLALELARPLLCICVCAFAYCMR
jgi:hypothetical protein